MALTEDATTLNIYLNDFGVTCQIGGGTAFLGIFNKPAEIIGGGLATSIEYLLRSNFIQFSSNGVLSFLYIEFLKFILPFQV